MRRFRGRVVRPGEIFRFSQEGSFQIEIPGYDRAHDDQSTYRLPDLRPCAVFACAICSSSPYSPLSVPFGATAQGVYRAGP